MSTKFMSRLLLTLKRARTDLGYKEQDLIDVLESEISIEDKIQALINVLENPHIQDRASEISCKALSAELKKYLDSYIKVQKSENSSVKERSDTSMDNAAAAVVQRLSSSPMAYQMITPEGSSELKSPLERQNSK